MTAVPPLTWVQLNSSLWVSAGGRYAILHSILPEMQARRTEIYTVRKRDPASARANPATLGYHLAERYTLVDAQREADQDNWADAQGAERNVPESFPAVALKRFFWPISNGTARGALVIAWRDGNPNPYVQVVGMSRGDDGHYRPGIYAEIELTPELFRELEES